MSVHITLLLLMTIEPVEELAHNILGNDLLSSSLDVHLVPCSSVFLIYISLVEENSINTALLFQLAYALGRIECVNPTHHKGELPPQSHILCQLPRDP